MTTDCICNLLIRFMFKKCNAVSLHLAISCRSSTALDPFKIYEVMSSFGFDFIPIIESFMKNAVFWDVMHCGSCKNQCFGGMYHLHAFLHIMLRFC
jgi:hypothetical protein